MINKLLKRQEIRFLIVGVLNTIVGYGLYALFVFFKMNYLVANTLSTVLGVIHSYLWNRFFTFQSKEKAGTEIAKFISVYIISYLIGMCTLIAFKNILHLNPYLAGLVNLGITTIISWFGHKNFSFKKIGNLDAEEPYIWEWILAGALILFLFLNFIFGDVLLTSNASITFDKLLFEGNLYNLYAANYHTFTGMFTDTCITYDFPIYIFFGIWNLPMLLFTKLIDAHWETYYFNILYVKAFLLVLTTLSLWVMGKICNFYHLKKQDKKMYNFLFITSSLVLMVITIFCGYDILSIFFTLLGIYFYLKDDLKKFTIFFAIAISLKLFALLIFIPLLLFKEKSIPKLFLYGICAISVLAFAKLVYYNAPLYQLSMSSFETAMLGKFGLSYINTPFNNTSIYMTLYFLLCIWCYHKNITDKKLQNLYTMYIPLLVFGFFAIFCQIHPQWIILLMPYLIFFLVYNKKDRKINILIETAFGVATLMILFAIYNGVFHPSLLGNMLLNKLIPRAITPDLIPLVNLFLSMSGVINAAILATFGYFIWINRPEKLIKQEAEPNEKWPHSLLLLRMASIIPFVSLIIYAYLT